MKAEKLLTVDDATEWRAISPASFSVFGSVEYARISQEHTSHLAHLFVVETEDSWIAYPFCLRSVNSLPFLSDVSETLWDTFTPEFTGPVGCRSNSPSVGAGFADRYSKYCREQGIVAEFAHLHPWTWRTESLEPSCVEFDREIVYVDLTLSEDQLWLDSFTYACRKNIKRGCKEKVRVFQATRPGDIREFHRIYIHTMERNQAVQRYLFPVDYFMAFFEQMPGNARFTLAEYKDQIVAGTLYLHDDINVYSYLGGADHAFQNVRPTNAVIYETIRWAQSQGKRRLILGGGYRPDDGIFRFKASFSPLRAKFHIYRRIHLPDVYVSLCNAWSAYYHSDVNLNSYFPAYRSIPVGTEEEP